MNERIKQLLKESTESRWYCGQEHDEVDQEKFAELIVKECLDQITSGPDPAYYATEAVVRIRKHFGIS